MNGSSATCNNTGWTKSLDCYRKFITAKYNDVENLSIRYVPMLSSSSGVKIGVLSVATFKYSLFFILA